ncbi:MAG: helix-turn-helix domain-containing protein [Lachnospiraceae bacterium]|nr:helix-turn-helix domain-containing protein [Lachnospiraceae bacterium]MDD7703107.1 helix-turn-helix domain-containing protein [Lachnospiraceae bacterium]MDY3301740.1 helix-turn-helix domain-containing protein [Lachnospiraceae bacterium]
MSDPNKKLNSLILKLQKETGLKLTIASDKDPDQETLDKLEHLISQVKTTSSKSSVLSGYLNGVISESEARQLLIRKASDEKPAELFLLHFDNKLDEDSGVLSVLSELFDTSTTEILRMDDNEVLVLHFRHKEHDISELEETAGYLVDTMNTEALASVSVSYDSMALDFSELPLTYRHLKAAMKIGRTFRTSERIFGYHSLGLGKLISSISNESAREFLEEELPGIDFRQFDSETMNTIEVFFASGLNIAEAARALYLHRNTLVYRLDKFKKTTGCDLQNFDDAVKIRIGMLLSQKLNQE